MVCVGVQPTELEGAVDAYEDGLGGGAVTATQMVTTLCTRF